jgi:hypothetical protein
LLAHFTFWDQRVLVLLRRWKERGFDPSPVNALAVNEALLPRCTTLDPHSAAEAINGQLEALSPESFERFHAHAQATSTRFRMNRSLCRMTGLGT